MKKFDELYSRIIAEATEQFADNEEAPFTDQEKDALRTMLEKNFQSNAIRAIIQAAQMAIRDIRNAMVMSGDDSNASQYMQTIEYLDEFIDNPTKNDCKQMEELKQMFIDYCLENEEEAYKVLSKRGWIMKGIVMTDAFLVKLGERFGFDGRKLK